MGKKLDLIGQKFGRLKALSINGMSKKGSRMWLCQCDCGGTHTVETYSLTSGMTRSCGCLKVETALKMGYKHGLVGTRLYGIWRGMKCRCNMPNNHAYKDYGARGVKICKEWLENPQVFIDWANNNGYADHLTIERVDSDGDYEPANCTWIEHSEQSKNRRSLVWLEYEGETRYLEDWGRLYNIDSRTIRQRLKRGWTMEKALNAPIRRVGVSAS